MDMFMLIFRDDAQAEQDYANQSPEARQAELQKWNSWIGSIAAQGRLVGAEALAPGGKTLTAAGTVHTDGPYTEGKEIVGYLTLKAGSLEEAAQLAQGCPVFETNGTVEIRPVINFEQ
ncbi:YciI family protein [Hymenobacter terrenus]|uniref:YciI family protein n=1 Tax=Hymenobacter terrenus TaxID=1629124 RepID=UPI0006193BC5|nr:YciI family protein [Hymenobacter terrenus]